LNKNKTSQIKIGDEIQIDYKKDKRFYKLVDIAIWHMSKRIKTILFEEIKPPYNYEMHKYMKIKHKPKYKMVHRDQFIIKIKGDSRAYQLVVYRGYTDHSKIGSVHFKLCIAVIPIIQRLGVCISIS